MRLIHCFYEIAQQQTIEKLNDLKLTKFSIKKGLNQTNGAAKRIGDIPIKRNVHSGNGTFFYLGVARILDVCTAEIAAEMIMKKMEEFQITDTDIVSSTTDGASVMNKFQTCYKS